MRRPAVGLTACMFVSETISLQVVYALGTRSGGEVFDLE